MVYFFADQGTDSTQIGGNINWVDPARDINDQGRPEGRPGNSSRIVAGELTFGL